jgi:hypothetical protein
MKVIRYIEHLKDEFNEYLKEWAVYEENITEGGSWTFKDAKILKIFSSLSEARNWMENDGKKN